MISIHATRLVCAGNTCLQNKSNRPVVVPVCSASLIVMHILRAYSAKHLIRALIVSHADMKKNTTREVRCPRFISKFFTALAPCARRARSAIGKHQSRSNTCLVSSRCFSQIQLSRNPLPLSVSPRPSSPIDQVSWLRQNSGNSFKRCDRRRRLNEPIRRHLS